MSGLLDLLMGGGGQSSPGLLGGMQSPQGGGLDILSLLRGLLQQGGGQPSPQYGGLSAGDGPNLYGGGAPQMPQGGGEAPPMQPPQTTLVGQNPMIGGGQMPPMLQQPPQSPLATMQPPSGLLGLLGMGGIGSKLNQIGNPDAYMKFLQMQMAMQGARDASGAVGGGGQPMPQAQPAPLPAASAPPIQPVTMQQATPPASPTMNRITEGFDAAFGKAKTSPASGTTGITTPPNPAPGSYNNPQEGEIKRLQAMLAANPFMPENAQKALQSRIDALQKAAEPTDAIKNYRLYVQQEEKAGRRPLTFNDFQGKDKIEKEVVGKFADRLSTGYDSATAAADAIRAQNDLRAQIDSKTGIFTGQFADNKLALAKFAEFLGKPLDPRVTTTETFKSVIGQQVAALVKNFGSGTSITNQDREYAQKMAAGDISLDETSIRRVFDILEKMNRTKIDRHNGMVDKVGTYAPAGAEMLGTYRVDVPEKYRAAPQAPTMPIGGQMTQIADRGPAGKAMFDALPSGARFIDPDGKPRIKP